MTEQDPARSQKAANWMVRSKTSNNSPGTILVVEDNEATRYTLSRHLRLAGYKVMEAESGNEGLRLARTKAPDVILLDVGLPDISGLEVCRDLKGNPRTASAAVIQVSAAFTSTDDRVRGLEGGADSYLTQPFEPRVLLAQIAALMRVHQAEDALRKATEAQGIVLAQLDAVIEGMAEGLLIADLEGRILRYNAAAAHMAGFKHAVEARDHVEHYREAFEVLDLNGRSLPHESWPLLRAVRGDRFTCLELRVRRHDTGHEFIASYSGTQVKDASGKPILAVLSMRDVTEQKRAQLALALAQADLQKQAATLEKTVNDRTSELRETNAELESFCYSLSHDMRAPLRAIRSYTELVLHDCSSRLPEASNEHLLKVTEAARRLDQLIQDVLTFTRLPRQQTRLERVDPGEVLSDLIEHSPELQSSGAQFSTDNALPQVKAHRGLLSQCLAHLLSNAVKFVGPGVTPRVRIYGEEKGDRVRLWVKDNGIGIDPTVQPRIFGLFERGHRSERGYAGTGVGLAIVKRAAARMQGTVGVESKPGQGSRFWLELPRAS